MGSRGKKTLTSIADRISSILILMISTIAAIIEFALFVFDPKRRIEE